MSEREQKKREGRVVEHSDVFLIIICFQHKCTYFCKTTKVTDAEDRRRIQYRQCLVIIPRRSSFKYILNLIMEQKKNSRANILITVIMNL